MSVYFGYSNILETTTVTITSEAAGYPGYRLYDKSMSLPWKATSAVTQTIKTNAGAGNTNIINRMIITNHNLSCVTNLELDWSDNNSDWTNIVTLTPSDDTTINSSFTASTHRYFRVVLNSPSSTPEAGEIYLGSSVEISRSPIEGLTSGPQYVRAFTETQSGLPWTIENGPPKDKFIGDFEDITATEKNYISAACDEISFFFIDHLDILRYIEVKNLDIVGTNNGNFNVHVDFLETEVI